MNVGDLVRLTDTSIVIGIVIEIEREFYARRANGCSKARALPPVDRLHVLWNTGDVTFEPATYVSMIQQESV